MFESNLLVDLVAEEHKQKHKIERERMEEKNKIS